MFASLSILVLLSQLNTAATAACTAGSGGGGTLSNSDCASTAGAMEGFVTDFAALRSQSDDVAVFLDQFANGFGAARLADSRVSTSFTGHGFLTVCQCDPLNVCPDTTATGTTCAAGTYAIAKSSGGFICLKFGATTALQLPNADSATAETMATLSSQFLAVTIGSTSFTFDFGIVATSGGGTKIRMLFLLNAGSQGLVYSACGPLIVQDGNADRKRNVVSQALTTGRGTMVTAAPTTPAPPVSASGDPHLVGAHGIKFDVFGESAANYSLVVAPAFEVNMQLANRGPDMRFMVGMVVLFRGESFTVTPWTIKNKPEREALVKRFAALGAQVTLDEAHWLIKITICEHHTIEFQTHHSAEHTINYLNFAMEVFGCHDAYGGLLGQTYQCKYVQEKFEWSREREAAFRVSTLESPSGSYSPLVKCANEDEYRGEAISGGSIGGGGGGNVTVELTRRRRR